MKTTPRIAAFALLTLLGALSGQAAITIPGADGSDGDLNITADTVIDLSQAVTGAWDANNAANAGQGIYDPNKWAVVFKYSSVTVAAGKYVTFKNHPSRAPVVWLISGNANITGTVYLNGANGANSGPTLAEPGPGGFRGGQGYVSAGDIYGTAGFGVGGGKAGIRNQDRNGSGGSYGSQGANSTAVPYGNPSIIPLIGGSGGGSAAYYPNGGGGAGAILMACANTLTIGGGIYANGGAAGNPNDRTAGGGSGGGIRLVADTLAGGGAIQAVGGGNGFQAGLGRIRLERANNSNTSTVSPDPSIVPISPGDTALLWPPSDAPQVKIVSIGGQSIGLDPRAEFGTIGADAVLPQTSSAQVLIETTNVEQASQVKVRGTPRSEVNNSGNYTEVSAAVSSVVSTTPLVVRWTATLPVGVGYGAVQVKVIRP